MAEPTPDPSNKPLVDVPVIANSELPTGSYARSLYQRVKTSLGLELDAKQFKDAWQWTNNTVLEPCEKVYSRLPSQLTEVKKPYLQIRESNRLLVLSGVTLFIAGASRKYNQNYLKTFRNVIFSFYGFGLVIAPEVYSPFMRKDLR